MSYRDPLQASLDRLDALQRELDQRVQQDAATETELTQLRENLRVARKEVDRLRSQLPSAKQARKPFQASLLIFVGLALATAVAGYHSESAGVRMSYVASAPLGFGIGGLLWSKHRWLSAAIGAGLVPALVAIFYQGIWPSL